MAAPPWVRLHPVQRRRAGDRRCHPRFRNPVKPHPVWAACVIAGCTLGLPAAAQTHPSPVPTPPPALQMEPAVAPAVAPAVVLAVAGPAHPPPTLAQALEAAWQRTTAAREATAQRDLAQARRRAADSLFAAPPTLEIQTRTDRLHGQRGARETELAVSGPLWWPGQRAAQLAAADAALESAGAAEAAARWRLAGGVRQAAAQLWALQAEHALAMQVSQGLRALADDVDRRVQAGDLAPADALAARAEALGAQAGVDRVLQQREFAQRQWALLTGLGDAPAPKPTSTSTHQPEPQPQPAGPTPLPDLQAALAAHPEQRLAEQAVTTARQRLEALQAGRRAPAELSLGLRQDVSGRGQTAQGSVAIGLRLPWGSAERSQPERTQAASELDIAMLQALRLRDRLLSAADDARAAVQAATQQVQMAEARATLLRERAGLIDQAHRAGQLALADLLRARAALAEAEATTTQHQQALHQARSHLAHTLGHLP